MGVQTAAFPPVPHCYHSPEIPLSTPGTLASHLRLWPAPSHWASIGAGKRVDDGHSFRQPRRGFKPLVAMTTRAAHWARTHTSEGFRMRLHASWHNVSCDSVACSPGSEGHTLQIAAAYDLEGDRAQGDARLLMSTFKNVECSTLLILQAFA